MATGRRGDGTRWLSRCTGWKMTRTSSISPRTTKCATWRGGERAPVNGRPREHRTGPPEREPYYETTPADWWGYRECIEAAATRASERVREALGTERVHWSADSATMTISERSSTQANAGRRTVATHKRPRRPPSGFSQGAGSGGRPSDEVQQPHRHQPAPQDHATRQQAVEPRTTCSSAGDETHGDDQSGPLNDDRQR